MARTVRRYQNAAQILPKALLLEVQRLAAGKVLYVPYPVSKRDFNRMKVLDLRMQGYSLTEISFKTGMSTRGVCKILQNDRERAFTTLQYIKMTDEPALGEMVTNGVSGEMPPSRQTAPIMAEDIG